MSRQNAIDILDAALSVVANCVFMACNLTEESVLSVTRLSHGGVRSRKTSFLSTVLNILCTLFSRERDVQSGGRGKKSKAACASVIASLNSTNGAILFCIEFRCPFSCMNIDSISRSGSIYHSRQLSGQSSANSGWWERVPRIEQFAPLTDQ